MLTWEFLTLGTEQVFVVMTVVSVASGNRRLWWVEINEAHKELGRVIPFMNYQYIPMQTMIRPVGTSNMSCYRVWLYHSKWHDYIGLFEVLIYNIYWQKWSQKPAIWVWPSLLPPWPTGQWDCCQNRCVRAHKGLAASNSSSMLPKMLYTGSILLGPKYPVFGPFSKILSTNSVPPGFWCCDIPNGTKISKWHSLKLKRFAFVWGRGTIL